MLRIKTSAPILSLLLSAALVGGCAEGRAMTPACATGGARAQPPASAVGAATVLARPLPAGIDSHFAQVGDLKLHYLRAGKGPPVILLHGYAETSRMWLPLMQQLAAERTVIAPDLRGAGASDKPESGYEKKQMAQDIRGLAEVLALGKAEIVGHDIGLMVAYAYAAQYPNDVERIALMDAFLPGVGGWKQVWLLRDLWHFHFTGEVPLLLVAGRERTYFEHFWNDFAADRRHSVPEAEREFYAASYAQPGGMRAGRGIG